MVKGSLLVKDLVDKMNNKSNVIINGTPCLYNIIISSNSTVDNMEVVSVDYFVEYEY